MQRNAKNVQRPYKKSYSALICQTLGWPWVYYSYGLLSIIWSVLWLSYARDSPAEMKNIDETERKYILKDLGQSGQKIHFKEIPWLQILQNVSFIGLCLTGFCQGINDFIMLEMMPQYLSHVKVSFTL